MDVWITNKTEDLPVSLIYKGVTIGRHVTIEGSLTNKIHPNLHKTKAYQCTPDDKMESSSTDLVVSRDGTSFGSMTI